MISNRFIFLKLVIESWSLGMVNFNPYQVGESYMYTTQDTVIKVTAVKGSKVYYSFVRTKGIPSGKTTYDCAWYGLVDNDCLVKVVK